MSTEAPKSPNIPAGSTGTMNATPNAGPNEQSQAAQLSPFPSYFNGTFPAGGAYPPLFAYAPPAEGEGGQNAPGGPFLIPFGPPGVVYAYPPPPPPSAPGFTQFNQPTTPPAPSRPKRRQVKMACTNCAAACKRCDDIRPCDRCVKYAIADTCVDGRRKARMIGIKRGPYKRKQKAQTDQIAPTTSFHPSEVEWVHPNQGAPPNAPSMHTFSPHPPPPPHDGPFYPYYFPPGFPPPPHGPDGVGESNGAPSNGNLPVLQYFMHPPPGGFPAVPFASYTYPAMPQHLIQQQPPPSPSLPSQQTSTTPESAEGPESGPVTVEGGGDMGKASRATGVNGGAAERKNKKGNKVKRDKNKVSKAGANGGGPSGGLVSQPGAQE